MKHVAGYIPAVAEKNFLSFPVSIDFGVAVKVNDAISLGDDGVFPSQLGVSVYQCFAVALQAGNPGDTINVQVRGVALVNVDPTSDIVAGQTVSPSPDTPGTVFALGPPIDPTQSLSFLGTALADVDGGVGGTVAVLIEPFILLQQNAVDVPVTSVFGRIGDVIAESGDYNVSEVTGAAPLASPAFTGNPIAPTQAPLDSTTKIATTAYSDAAVAVEKTRALAAEALLAPRNNPAFTNEVDISATWNNSATQFRGLKLNITNTASATTSLLADLQVGGASKFSVREDGTIAGPWGSLTFSVGNNDVSLVLASGTTVFRGLETTGWATPTTAMFFQIGGVSERVIFTTKSANTSQTMMLNTKTLQVAWSYNTAPLPLTDSSIEVIDVSNALKFRVSQSGNIRATGIPVFANNAAAIAGGLSVGDFYRTGANPDPVCVVH